MKRGAAQGFHAGTVLGFPVYIEESALYLGPLIFLFALSQASGTDLLRAGALIVVIIASVFAHELAHAVTAKALRVPVRHIALTWFGGYAAFWVEPTRGRDAAIAFAGPAANLIIAGMLFMATANAPSPHVLELSGSGPDILLTRTEPTFLEDVGRVGARINLALGAVNLLPALPLDGGHIFRAALATRMSRGRAGWIAAWVGIVGGATAVVYAFWVESLTLLLLGLFVGGSAWFERRALRYD